MVKFLMYNTNIFVHFQIYHDKALYNKGNTLFSRGVIFTRARVSLTLQWRLLVAKVGKHRHYFVTFEI